MWSYNRVIDLSVAIRDAKNIECIFRPLYEIVKDYGLSYFSYLADRSHKQFDNQSISYNSYSGRKGEPAAKSNCPKINTIVEMCDKIILPVEWSGCDRNGSSCKKTDFEADISCISCHGLSFPLNGLQGFKGIFSIRGRLTQSEWREKRYFFIKDFSFIGQVVHNKVVELHFLSSERALTPREKQCVSGLVCGLSYKQIAFNIGISCSAVNLYISNAKKKLGCRTACELVIRFSNIDRLSIGDLSVFD